MDENSLSSLISDLVVNAPPEIIEEIVGVIHGWKGVPSDFQKIKLLASLQNVQTKSRMKKILDFWTTHYPEITSSSVLLSIQSSSQTLHTLRIPSLELIWTGPEKVSTTFRRTDQALLELIRGSSKDLLIVSFAVYKAQLIIEEIKNAISRNVRVIICLEDFVESQGKISFSGMNAFTDNIFNLASFYSWPIEKRLHTGDGKFGALHAKIAVADRKKVFLSSANLTDYAMDLNIEMGVLIEDKVIGEQITDLFNNMIVGSDFLKIS